MNTLGYEDVRRSTMPKPLSIQAIGEVVKTVNGYGDSLILDDKKQLYHQGTGHVFGQNRFFTPLKTDPVKDFDCDKTNLVYMNDAGEVFESHVVEKAYQFKKVELPFPAKFVSSGSHFCLAVVEDELKTERVYIWGDRKQCEPSISMSRKIPENRQVMELEKLGALIADQKSSVKKIRTVDKGVVILLENGHVITWGENQSGNLGVPRSEYSLIHCSVSTPASPLALNNLDIKVTDFALSSNLLVLLSDKGEAYYCGINQHLKIEAVPFFPGRKVKAIGCNFNYFYLQDDKGTWFANRAFEDQELVKFYGSVNLVEVETEQFGERVIREISGKYENAFAI